MTDRPTPTVSRVLEDGTLIELLFDQAKSSTAFAVRTPNGGTSIETAYTTPTGERLAPYSPMNNLLANECVLFPSDIGEFGDKGDLLTDVRAFLDRYVELSPEFADMATHYVLLTWVFDAFSDLPYLRFRGDFGTGKTRALLTVGHLCYKPFFASGASTVSPIFHVLDVFGATLVLDEADFRFSDATAELTKILNNGNMRGLPVLRTMTNRHNELNPRAFRVYGPKIVGMRESYADRALESRFLTEETGGRAVPPHIPVHLPASFRAEALALRNRLLAWRFHARHGVGPLPDRLIAGGSPRSKQTTLALLSLVDDPALRAGIQERIERDQEAATTERSTTLEAIMLAALSEAFAAGSASGPKVGDIMERFNNAAIAELGRPMSNKWGGSFLRNRLRLRTAKSNGVYIVPAKERTRIQALGVRFGVLEVPAIDISSLS